ncbi:endolytic transglycosylase MltG [Vibrio rumoiensis]|uniref:Endolytic murein transglycosylase n=1 Tax=Vibrio rumoiensis 1S-45 TaxID=1188252 RepID=A0A1E5E463_9VIBR|nr:endolytic transglycosylase MltG [Vibrio rumoiensis]OEF26927.1 ABC transporter substrate-binding protein [Vibrio rumoiensis 1S-45]
MIKKLILLFIILVVAGVGAVMFAKSEVESYLNQPIKIGSDDLVTVEHGMSLRSTLSKMERAELIQASQFERLLPRLYPDFVHIKAGTYQVIPQMTLKGLLTEMVAGNEYQFTITFIEGSRFSEWRDQLLKAKGLKHKTEAMTEADIAKALGSDKEKLEGLMLAETYHYTEGTSDLAILKRSHKALVKQLNAAWETRQEGLPLQTPYQALTLASIIEKETAIESERERIASVFVNRLNKGMRLQTDPTVIYGLGDKYDGDIRKKDLTTPTPYNTYVINGLPPTPIAMPGVDSIKAALNPEKSPYLYFVASGNGGHVFSKSLAEHNRAVRNYLKQLRANKSKE